MTRSMFAAISSLKNHQTLLDGVGNHLPNVNTTGGVMNGAKPDFHTRGRAFDLGVEGTLVASSSGIHVVGWQANPTTELINTTGPPQR